MKPSLQPTEAAIQTVQPDAPPLLTQVTVQDIQLELIRRTRFNRFDGERIVHDLLEHRSLWVAALLDRPGRDRLLMLRGLPDNCWCADTLVIVAANEDAVRQLRRLGRRWQVDSVEVLHEAHTEAGIKRTTPVIQLWWD